jgi:hypothetical protein
MLPYQNEKYSTSLARTAVTTFKRMIPTYSTLTVLVRFTFFRAVLSVNSTTRRTTSKIRIGGTNMNLKIDEILDTKHASKEEFLQSVEDFQKNE